MDNPKIVEHEVDYITEKVMESPQNHYIRIGSDFSESIPDYFKKFSGAYIAVEPPVSVMKNINQRLLRRKKREERREERDKEGLVSDRGWEVKGKMKTKSYLNGEEAKKILEQMDKNRENEFFYGNNNL